MSYKDIMAMPMKSFWVMANNISRISAERDLRLLALHSVTQSEEGSKELQKELVREMGQVILMEKIEPERDEEGVSFLKSLG